MLTRISDRYDAARFIHEEQVAFDCAFAEEPLQDGPVAKHLGAVSVGKMADTSRLEVDQGDAVRGDNEPVDDAERPGVREVLFGAHGPRAEEDLAHLRVAQEPVDGSGFFIVEATPVDRSAIYGKPGECRVDPQTAFDPRLDVGRAQRRVNVIVDDLPVDEAGEVGRRQRFLFLGSRLLGSVVMPPAEFGPLGVRHRPSGGTEHQIAESFEVALFVGPQKRAT